MPFRAHADPRGSGRREASSRTRRRRRRGCAIATRPSHWRASSRAIGSPRPVPSGPCRPARPRIEALEDRLLLAGREARARGRGPRSRPGRRRSRPRLPAASSDARSRPARRARGRGRAARTRRVGRRPRRRSSSSRLASRRRARRQRSAARSRRVAEVDPLGRAARARRRGSGPAARRRSARAGRPRAAPPSSSAARSSVARAIAASSSSRSRSPVSGVRSWWEASATNSCWPRSSRPTRPVISLKVRASERCSVLPSTGARASRSPRRDAVARRVEPADRPRDLLRRSARRRRGRGRGRRQPEQGEAERSSVRTARLTAATLWVTRTAPTARPWLEDRHRGREDVGAERLAVAGLLVACCRRARRAISGRSA